MADQHPTPSSIWSRKSTEKSAFLASTGVGVQHNNHQPGGLSNNNQHQSRRENNHNGTNHNRHNNHPRSHGNNNNNNSGSNHNYNHRHRNHNNGHHVNQPDEVNEDGLRVVKPRIGSHILENSWTVWFLHRGPGFKISNYLLATKQVGTFSTVEEFWDVYCHLRRIDKLPFTSEFQIFKKNVKPMWEDPANAQGGKWVVRLKRPSKMKKPDDEMEDKAGEDPEEAARVAAEKNAQHIKCRQHAAVYWENLLLSIISGTLITDDSQEIAKNEIMGVVVSARRDEDILSVWTKRGDDVEGNTAIRDAIQRVLNLPDELNFEYKVHQESIKEGAEKQAQYEQTHSTNNTNTNNNNNNNNSNSSSRNKAPEQAEMQEQVA